MSASYYLLIVEVWSLWLRKSLELKYSSSRKHESILVHAVSRLCSTTVLHIRKVRFRKVRPERRGQKQCTQMQLYENENPERCRQPSRTLLHRQLSAGRGRMHSAAGREFTRRMAWPRIRLGFRIAIGFGGKIRRRPRPKRYGFVIARKFGSEGSGAQDKCCKIEWVLRAQGCQQGARHLALGILFIPPAHTFDEKRRSVQ